MCHERDRERNLSESESNISEGGNSKRIPSVASLLVSTGINASRNDRVFATGSEEVKGERPATKTPSRPMPRSPSVAMPATPGILPTQEPRPQSRTAPLQIGRVFAQHERRLMLLQRDRDIYDEQNQKMMHQIMSLTTQLEDAKSEAIKCIRLAVSTEYNRQEADR